MTISKLMNNIFIFLTVLILSGIPLAKNTYATNKIARTSAAITIPFDNKTDNRAALLRAYLLQFDSPLADSAEEFVKQADLYRLDWKFVAAVAGVESWFGNRIPANSYNGWGWGVYGGRVHRFSSWNEGIQIISQSIRERYMDTWGATNIYEIGSYYAADPAWANKVIHFVDDIDAFEKKSQVQTLSISI